MASYDENFNLSYWRVRKSIVDGVTFIDAFYDRFLSSSDEVAKKFASTDFKRQKLMVLLSFVHVLDLYSSGQPDDIMKDLARRHSRQGVDIPPRLYDSWLNALVETVERYDPQYTSDIGEAWRHVMKPGIEYMKAHY